jgi:hypothetical protein
MAVRLLALRRPPITPQEDSWYSFLLETESTLGLGQLKDQITSSRIESDTFQLVAWCLNELRYRVPPVEIKKKELHFKEL